MEREIKFRAKSLNGHWVEGYYIKFETRQICPMGDDELKDDEIVHLIARDGFADWNMPKQLEFIKIDKETKGQFTGLKDKNGKEIYEGDIVDLNLFLTKNNGVVNFGKYKQCDMSRDYECGNQGFYIDVLNDTYCTFRKDLYFYAEKSEVIGNIYENKELLKGETK